MGVEPPFLYDQRSQFSFNGPTDKSFNPKAATQASWTPARPRPKSNGPLVEFNQHPDSYLVVPYGNTNVKPMSPNTQTKVKRLRQAQLFLRAHQLVGALGALFCVIVINKTSGAAGWIIRIAPAVALVHTLYAVYHFCRGPTGRTPASTSSYMVFAATTDTALLPFLAFSAVMAHGDYTTNAYGWSTLFGTDDITYKVIYAFFLICVAEASLMVVSLGLGVYLASLFRKIARLPPDMNPLEANLTARPHKRNKSELSGAEKHMSDSTYGFSKGESPSIAASRRVPFMHTRTDSAEKLLPYGNDAARGSKFDLLHSSRANSPTRPRSALTPAVNARQAGTGFYASPARSAASLVPSESRNSWLSFCDYEGVPTPLSEEATKTLDRQVRPPSTVSPVSSRSHSRNRDYRGAPDQTAFDYDPFSSQQSPGRPSSQQELHDVPQQLQPQSLKSTPKKRSRDPLGMNPPSPYLDQNSYHDENQYQQELQLPSEESARTALQDTNGNTPVRPKNSSRPSSFIGSGGKSRFYGNLRSSIGPGKRNEDDKMDASDTSSDYDRTKTGMSENSNFEILGVDDDEYDGHTYVNIIPAESNWIANESNDEWSGEKRNVSSSTGLDLRGGYAGLGSEFGRGMGRRREVSGKVAEEGRSYGNEYGSEDGGAVEESRKKAGAAGWARFKGL